MFVGVELDAEKRRNGPRLGPPDMSKLKIPEAERGIKRSQERGFVLSARIAQLAIPTKDVGENKRGAEVGGTTKAQSPKTAFSARAHSAKKQGGDAKNPLGTPGRITANSSRMSSRSGGFSARMTSHDRTSSPSGRYHPDVFERVAMHRSDITSNIDYMAPHGAPDNDRRMKEASWLCSQAFVDQLRAYPDPFGVNVQMPGEAVVFDGNTQSARRPHRQHLETAKRRSMSIAPADDDWNPDQLPVKWPGFLHPMEGKWRSVTRRAPLPHQKASPSASRPKSARF